MEVMEGTTNYDLISSPSVILLYLLFCSAGYSRYVSLGFDPFVTVLRSVQVQNKHLSVQIHRSS